MVGRGWRSHPSVRLVPRRYHLPTSPPILYPHDLSLAMTLRPLAKMGMGKGRDGGYFMSPPSPTSQLAPSTLRSDPPFTSLLKGRRVDKMGSGNVASCHLGETTGSSCGLSSLAALKLVLAHPAGPLRLPMTRSWGLGGHRRGVGLKLTLKGCASMLGGRSHLDLAKTQDAE
jgi:hypothetical protein